MGEMDIIELDQALAEKPEETLDNSQFVLVSQNGETKRVAASEFVPTKDGGPMRGLFEGIDNVIYDKGSGMYQVWKDRGGLDDVTEAQMITIYNDSVAAYSGHPIIARGRAIVSFRSSVTNTIRMPMQYKFASGTNLEFIKMPGFGETRLDTTDNWDFAFADCNALRTIYAVLLIKTSPKSIFRSCKSLENVKIEAKASVSLSDSPKLTYDTLAYIPRSSSPSAAIVITVHANIFKLLDGKGSPEEYQATGHAKEEWQKIVTDAKAKQISFAQP